MMSVIVGLLIGLFAMMTLAIIKLAFHNAAMRGKLQTVEGQLAEHSITLQEQLQNIQLLLKRTKEQQEFKDTLELKWKTAMEELQEELQKRLKKDAPALKNALEKWKADFDKKLQDEYKKAVESIAFHTVEYKKTITKKRKQYSRKNKATKPQKQHRSIDDE